MLFNSIEFLVFFPLVLFLFYLIPHKFRWALLLIASYFFYGSWKIEFLSLLVISTVSDFFIAKNIHKSSNKKNKRLLLATSLFINLGILFFFKYSSFLVNEALDFSSFSNHKKEVIQSWFLFDLPVGISFYTFQTIGYTIDVYLKKTRPEKNIGKFALYVSYFPQLVAGPIERYNHLGPQLFKKVRFNYSNFKSGLRLMLYGFFVKMVIADNLAPLVDSVFNSPTDYSSQGILAGILGFGWQIYADFYGYSLIAIGGAKCMGVNLMDNFKTPYFSKSISEFWRRWHISLSTWFRDYLYLPLGGNKVSSALWVRNILAVFLLSGIWHGANWTFLIWGAIHALMYLAERYFPIKWKRKNILEKIGGLIITYLVVNLAWTFFRASSFENATQLLTLIAELNITGQQLEFQNTLLSFIVVFLVIEIASRSTRIDNWLNKLTFPFRWIIYGILLFGILGFAGTTNHPFIYFQF
ncbi:MAG: MBOAT family O-acyltransferase [Salibacteraceae bacterium]